MTFDNANPELPVNRTELAAFIDHMVLAPHTTPESVEEALAEARKWGLNALYVPSARLPLPEAGLPVGALVGYPQGADYSLAKAFAGRLAVDQGATELCMVADLGAIAAGQWNAVMADMVTVREAAPSPVQLQVVLEASYLLTLPEGEENLARCCQIALAAGVDVVVTASGLHPSGGASVEAVRVMSESVGGQVGVKAMGGVATAEQALALMEAGATHLGCVGEETAAVLAGMPA